MYWLFGLFLLSFAVPRIRTIYVSILILISRLGNVLALGAHDEMLCTRAWRNRTQFGWRVVQLFFDHYCIPLSWWKYPGMTHCQSCYWAERSRLHEKIKELDMAACKC